MGEGYYDIKSQIGLVFFKVGCEHHRQTPHNSPTTAFSSCYERSLLKCECCLENFTHTHTGYEKGLQKRNSVDRILEKNNWGV